MKMKILFAGQLKDGKKYLIRYPSKNDAAAMCAYINTLSQERTFINFQGEKISLKDEIDYLQNQLKKIKQKLTIQLLVFCGSKVIGVSEISMKDKTESHIGFFGLSLAKEFRGQGIGTILMQLVLKEAVKNLPQLRIIILQVFENNPIAYAIYKKLGFQEFGRLPEGILHKGQYVDDIFMYKKMLN